VLAEIDGYPILHFACHAFAPPKPLDGGFVMANDEIMGLRDFQGLRLSRARVAILSACETSVQGVELPDEAVSLATSLLQAGVSGVVGSMWSVTDASTMMLMTRFYEQWRNQRLTPAKALTAAQHWIRDSTNGEKLNYFDSLPHEGRPSEAHSVVLRQLAADDSDGLDFANPSYWAAFCYTGV
jgi:CHAT domain-containing protein